MDYTVLSRIDSVGDQLFRLPSIEEDQPLSPTFVNQSSFVANIAASFAGADDVFLRGADKTTNPSPQRDTPGGVGCPPGRRQRSRC